MKVALLCSSFRKDTARGIDRYASMLIERLRVEEKISIEALVDQHSLPYSMLAFFFRELTSPLRLLGAKADVYHAVSPILGKTAVIARKSPLVTTFHDLVPFKGAMTHFYLKSDRSYLYSRFCFSIAKRSDLIIAPFEVTKQDLISILKVPAAKIRVIPYGVDSSFFQPSKTGAPKSSAKDRKVVLSILGDICEEKGVDSLLRSFTLISQDADCELWVGGRWGERASFDRLVQELGIADRVKHLGFVPEARLPYYYSSADIFVLPSRQGFSLPILEAMASGTAVIGPDTPDVKEAVGNSALLVNPTDVAALAEAMQGLLMDDKMRTRLAEEGYEKAKEFTWDRVARDTLKVYQELSS